MTCPDSFRQALASAAINNSDQLWNAVLSEMGIIEPKELDRTLKSYVLLDDEGTMVGARFDFDPQQIRALLARMKELDGEPRKTRNDDWTEFRDQLEVILRTIEQQ